MSRNAPTAFPVLFSTGEAGVSASFPDLREKTAAEFLNYFSSLFDDDNVFEEYKNRSFVIGKSVEIVNTATGNSYSATVLDIDNKCRLVIEDGSGAIKTLSSGEIRIKI